jgi:phage-related protein
MTESLRESAVELSAEGIVHLYKVVLRAGSGDIYITPDDVTTWQGFTFQNMACQLTGVASHASEQSARPRFTVQNPDGAFTSIVAQGSLENARLTRYRLLRKHAEENINIYTSQTWRVSRVSSLNKFMFSVDLRSMDDRANFTIPSKTFIPPDFPAVTIS